jgi:hypothetical protein
LTAASGVLAATSNVKETTMTQWWEIGTADAQAPVPKVRAVAYYRHSAQDRQENSIPIQQEQVREWIEKNGVETPFGKVMVPSGPARRRREVVPEIDFGIAEVGPSGVWGYRLAAKTPTST